MKTALTYRVFALMMAVLLFFSTVGISADVHMCQDKVKSLSFLGKAKSCYEIGQITDVKFCKNHAQQNKTGEPGINKKDCCDNTTKVFQNDGLKQIEFINNFKLLKPFLSAFFVSFLLPKHVVKEQVDHYKHYTKPKIYRDYCALYQSFLL